MAEQAKGPAFQFDDGEVQQAELRGLLPAPGTDRRLVVGQAGGEGEQQQERVLSHRRCAVALAVADHDAIGAGGGEVDVVSAGGGHQDQLQLRVLANGVGVDLRLVGDRHGRPAQAFGHFAGQALVMQHQLAEGLAQRLHVEIAEIEGGMVEEHGARAVHV
ncbi:hypothetical protein D3C76_1067140 [compost metagenome]